jgi:hypothetical protein
VLFHHHEEAHRHVDVRQAVVVVRNQRPGPAAGAAAGAAGAAGAAAAAGAAGAAAAGGAAAAAAAAAAAFTAIVAAFTAASHLSAVAGDTEYGRRARPQRHLTPIPKLHHLSHNLHLFIPTPRDRA